MNHGTNQGWLDGCRDRCCMNARKTYHTKRRNLVRIRGNVTGGTPVPSKKVLTHLDKLQAAGYGYKKIAAAAGMSPWTVKSILMRRPKKIAARSAQAILQTPLERLETDKTVDGTGTVRRLRALYWMTYSPAEVEEACGGRISKHYAYTIMRGHRSPDRVRKGTFKAVRDAYDHLLLREVPPDDRFKTRFRRRKNAEDLGWISPGWWRDIDNPREDPTKFMHRTGKKAAA